MSDFAAGGSEGGPNNVSAGSDQWLYVITGKGTVIIEGSTCYNLFAKKDPATCRRKNPELNLRDTKATEEHERSRVVS